MLSAAACSRQLRCQLTGGIYWKRIQGSLNEGFSSARTKDTIVLFDIDGTLTNPRSVIHESMIETITALKAKHYIGVVSGSDLSKVNEQLTKEVVKSLDFCFCENGLYALKSGEFFAKKNISEELGEAKLQKFINNTLRLLSEINLPVKRGTFIEYRSGMLNISPIGRNCSQAERNAFEEYDKVMKQTNKYSHLMTLLQLHSIRQKLIDDLQQTFATEEQLHLKYSIGGQISFDVFPVGWDKTYCLRFLEDFHKIHFFGDKTFPGGNDYEIFTSERTIGHSVKSPEETITLIKQLFLL